MKKRILPLVLALTLLLLSACGNASAPAAAPTAESQPAPEETAAPNDTAAPEETAESVQTQKTERAAANELTVGIAQDFDSLDPDYMTAAGTKEILFNVFEGLVKPTSAGDIVPAVASEVVKSDDGLSYTFTLREGVKFHNGNPVTMDDLVYSIERRWNSEDTAALLHHPGRLHRSGDRPRGNRPVQICLPFRAGQPGAGEICRLLGHPG